MFRIGAKAKTLATGQGAARIGRRRGRAAQNLGLLLILWLTGVGLLHLGGPQRYAGLAEGQRAPVTVVAAIDFECENLAATELLRQQALETVVPVFSIQSSSWLLYGHRPTAAAASELPMPP